MCAAPLQQTAAGHQQRPTSTGVRINMCSSGSGSGSTGAIEAAAAHTAAAIAALEAAAAQHTQQQRQQLGLYRSGVNSGAAAAGAGARLQLAAYRLLLLGGDAQAARARIGRLVPFQLQRLAQLQAQVACAAASSNTQINLGCVGTPSVQHSIQQNFTLQRSTQVSGAAAECKKARRLHARPAVSM